MTLVLAEVTAATELESVFAELIAKGTQGLVVQQDPLFTGQGARIVALAETSRLPAIYALRTFYDAGGLMWYGSDIVAQFRQSANYVNRILKGARPSKLPVERPAKLILAINAKLAERLSIRLDPGVMARADDVIE